MRSIVCVLPLFVLVLMLSYADAKEKRTDEKNHDSKHDSMTGDSDKTKLHGKMMMMEKHFIEMMISHHQEAVDMANLAVEKSRKDYIKSFSENIVKAQNSEIALMKKFYKEWMQKCIIKYILVPLCLVW